MSENKTIIRVDVEPGIINSAMIVDAAKEMAPKGKPGKVFLQQELDIYTMKNLRLEFRSILRLDHLWMLKSLTSLSLSNNIIEKIENLDALINLTQLNLSFNRIAVIENLAALKKLEILSLYSNKIKKLENIDDLVMLEVLTIGQNLIDDKNCILYLRKFVGLRTLNLQGNPCAEAENFCEYVAAYIPQLVYYEYKMISEKKKEKGEMLYRNELKLIKEAEEEESKNNDIEIKKLARTKYLAKSYIDGLEDDELYEKFFEKDTEGKTIMEIGEKVQDIYDNLKEDLKNICAKIFSLGQAQFKLRSKEISKFKKVVGENKDKWLGKSRTITDKMDTRKNEMENKIKEISSGKDFNTDDKIDEALTELDNIRGEFEKMQSDYWYKLMENEMYLNEQMEELNGRFERNLLDLINIFIEGVQGLFGQMRESEMAYFEGLMDKVNRYLNAFVVRGTTPPSSLTESLLIILQSKDTITNALGASHDVHLQVIDSAEDSILKRIREWHKLMCLDLVQNEMKRNRKVVFEISQVLDCAKSEFEGKLKKGYQEIHDCIKGDRSSRFGDTSAVIAEISALLASLETKGSVEEDEFLLIDGDGKKEDDEGSPKAEGPSQGVGSKEEEEKKKGEDEEEWEEGLRPPQLPQALPPVSNKDEPAYPNLIVREIFKEDSGYDLAEPQLKHIDSLSKK